MQLIAFCLLAIAATASPDSAPLPWLGLSFTWAESDADRHVLHVRSVTPDGPAHRAGVRAGDLVTAVNGAPVDFGDELEFLLYLRQRRPGERLRLTLVREGRTTKTVLVVGTLPPASRAKWERNLQMAREKRAARAP